MQNLDLHQRMILNHDLGKDAIWNVAQPPSKAVQSCRIDGLLYAMLDYIDFRAPIFFFGLDSAPLTFPPTPFALASASNFLALGNDAAF